MMDGRVRCGNSGGGGDDGEQVMVSRR